MIRSDLNAIARPGVAERLQMVGLGSTGYDSTPVRADCQTLSALLESQQALEDLHAGAIAFHWPRFLVARARRARLERMIFAGGVR